MANRINKLRSRDDAMPLNQGGPTTRYVSAREAKQSLGKVLDSAQQEPVTIRRQNRAVAVVLSAQEYARVCAQNREEFLRFADRQSHQAKARGLSKSTLDEIIADEE